MAGTHKRKHTPPSPMGNEARDVRPSSHLLKFRPHLAPHRRVFVLARIWRIAWITPAVSVRDTARGQARACSLRAHHVWERSLNAGATPAASGADDDWA
eukprot:4988057-Alexandrium_andersonii.AAC.1